MKRRKTSKQKTFKIPNSLRKNKFRNVIVILIYSMILITQHMTRLNTK